MAKRTIKTTSSTKTKVKAAPKAVKQTAAKAAAAPARVNVHAEAGVNAALYKGDSPLLNANRKTRVLITAARPTSTMSDRMKTSLYALRDAYGTKRFNARGLDNGVVRDLRAAGLISLSGGMEEKADGKTYMVDGEKPLQIIVTKAGQEYGKVSASA